MINKLSFKEEINEYATKKCSKMLLEMSVHEKQAFINLQFLAIYLSYIMLTFDPMVNL